MIMKREIMEFRGKKRKIINRTTHHQNKQKFTSILSIIIIEQSSKLFNFIYF